MARAELKAGSGPGSAEIAEASVAAGTAVEGADSFGAAAASFSRAQANRVMDKANPRAAESDKRVRPPPRCPLNDLIVHFSPPALSAALDARGKQFQCSLSTARSWARQKCTCSRCP